MKLSIWAGVTVTFASSARLNRAGPTRATKSPMMVTTTSISMRVTPAWPVRFRLRFVVWAMLYRHVVNARNREQHAENQGADQDAHHQDDDGLEDGGEAPDGGAGIGFVNLGHAGKHLVEAAGFFAHGEQVGGEGRKNSGLAHGSGDAFAAFDAEGDAGQGAGDGLVVECGGGDAERLDERHRVADQGSHGAGEAGGFGLEERIAQQGELEARAVPPEAASDGAGVDPPDNQASYQNAGAQPPPGGHEVAHVEQHFGWQGDLHGGIAEDAGEARDHEGEQEHDGSEAHAGQQDGVNHRRNDVVAQVVAGALELGQAFEDDGERAGGFAGADHVGVEIAEVPRVGAEAVGEGAPALQNAKDVEDDEAEAGMLGELGGDREGAVPGDGGVEQGGKLLGEEEDVAASLAEGGELELEGGFTGGDADVDGSETLFAELAGDELLIVAGEAAGADLAVASHGSEEESGGH